LDGSWLPILHNWDHDLLGTPPSFWSGDPVLGAGWYRVSRFLPEGQYWYGVWDGQQEDLQVKVQELECYRR
jgi:hypothetical protein